MTVTVIIPVFNGARFLERALSAIKYSTVAPTEVIVVDDGSTDDSRQKAAAFGAKVIPLSGRAGPARARNIGAKAASGEILLFLDADVCAALDVIERVQNAFTDPTLDALLGSYDDDPSSPDFLSQYKNLMHCFTHQNARSDATTFWSGCGAIRRDLFLSYSGFNEGYKRPAIEDIELGYRMANDNRRIVLDRDLKVKHLKKWTFWGLVKTDVLDRGIPWTELILRDKRMPDDLNVQLSQRVSVALVYLALVLATISAIRWEEYFLTPFAAMLFLLLGRYWSDPWGERPGWAVALFGIGVTAFCIVAWKVHMPALIPLVLLGMPALLLRHRYQDGSPKYVMARVASAVVMCAGLGAVLYYSPAHPFTLGLGAVLLVILILNKQFYVFLAAKQGKYFAVAAIPFHLLYHLYNGISFLIGSSRWALGNLSRNAAPEPPLQLDPSRPAPGNKAH